MRRTIHGGAAGGGGGGGWTLATSPSVDDLDPPPIEQGSGTVVMGAATIGDLLWEATDVESLRACIADIRLGVTVATAGEAGQPILVDMRAIIGKFLTGFEPMNPHFFKVIPGLYGQVAGVEFTGMLILDSTTKFRVCDSLGDPITTALAPTDYLRISYRGLITND